MVIMATIDTGSAETTIMVEAIAVKAKLGKLQNELEQFLHETSPDCEQKPPIPSYPDPLNEVIAILQDCGKLVQDIHHLAFNRIASRVMK